MVSTTPPTDPQPHIETGIRHANPTWHKSALAAVKKVAKKNETFTARDVLILAEDFEIQTHDKRAMGGVMREARDLGYIKSDGFVRRCDRYNRGASTLWRSLIYQPKK